MALAAAPAKRRSCCADIGMPILHLATYHLLICLSSMGGLLAADALIEFVRTRPDQTAPLWPNIVACLAYDTPVSAHRSIVHR